MYRVRVFIAIIILQTLLTGCVAFIQEPVITVKGTSLVGLDSSGVDIEFNLVISNPNTFDLSLLGYTYDLSVMSLPLSTGGTQQTVNFPSGKETDIRLPVHLKFSDLLEIIKRQPDLDKLPYEMSARLHLEYPWGEMVIPVEKVDTLVVPEQYRPEAAINRLRDMLRGIR